MPDWEAPYCYNSLHVLVHFVMTYNFTLYSLVRNNENINILELLPVYSMVIDLTKPALTNKQLQDTLSFCLFLQLTPDYPVLLVAQLVIEILNSYQQAGWWDGENFIVHYASHRSIGKMNYLLYFSDFSTKSNELSMASAIIELQLLI
jgi:hypothetical protein